MTLKNNTVDLEISNESSGTPDARIQKWRTLFGTNFPPKRWIRHLLHEKEMKIAFITIRLIFGRFSLVKTLKSKPFGALSQFLK